MALSDRIHQLQTENRDLRQQLYGVVDPPADQPQVPDMDTLTDRVGKLETKLDSFDNWLRSVETAVGVANTKLDGLNGRLDDLGRRMDDLGRRMDDATRRFDTAVATAIGRVPSWWQMPVVIRCSLHNVRNG